MARAKASDLRKAKSNIADELIHGMAKLRELSAQIEDLSREGFPYREASRARTELSLRETIRRLFGEKSPEYQTHKHHKLRVGNRAESTQSINLIKQLITSLESQNADLLGLRLPPSVEQAGASMDRPALTSVPLSSASHSSEQSIPSVASTAAGDTTNPSSTLSTSNIPAPVLPIIPDAPTVNPAQSLSVPPPKATSSESAPAASPAQPPESALPSSSETTTLGSASGRDKNPMKEQLPTAASSSSCAIEEATSLTAQSDVRPPLTAAPSEPTAIVRPIMTEQSKACDLPSKIPSVPGSVMASMETPVRNDQSDAGNPPLSAESFQPAQPRQSADTPPEIAGARVVATENALSEGGTLDLLRRVCTRFHLVARQLRLRKEYRPTLEITDEYDLQDLFYALLRLQFDEVGTEDWIPAYTNGARRTSYLLDWDRTVVVVKQTRSGLTTKDLAEQVKSDAARYAARPEGTTLLCFIYDPDGRVGNPRGLEADLTTVSDNYMVEVIVAPK